MMNFRPNNTMLASWLVMLAAVGALFLVGSADAGYTVSVTPAEQNGVPEETLSFTITIDNTIFNNNLQNDKKLNIYYIDKLLEYGIIKNKTSNTFEIHDYMNELYRSMILILIFSKGLP